MAVRPVPHLSVNELVEYLEANGLRPQTLDSFRNNIVDGKAFLRLTEDDIKELAPLIGERTLVRELIRQNKEVS